MKTLKSLFWGLRSWSVNSLGSISINKPEFSQLSMVDFCNRDTHLEVLFQHILDFEVAE